MELAAIMVDGKWQPGIGDPTFTGWVTVVAYFLAAALCCRRVVVVLPRQNPILEPKLFWVGLAVCLVALGCNKQLDLQSWLTAAVRDLSRDQGWYAYRRTFQIGGIVVLAAAALVAVSGMTWWLRPWKSGLYLALAGAGLLAVFVVARAASFHHIDRLIGAELLGVRMNAVLELGGIGCIAAAALRDQAHSAVSRPAAEPSEASDKSPPASSREQHVL